MAILEAEDGPCDTGAHPAGRVPELAAVAEVLGDLLVAERVRGCPSGRQLGSEPESGVIPHRQNTSTDPVVATRQQSAPVFSGATNTRAMRDGESASCAATCALPAGLPPNTLGIAAAARAPFPNGGSTGRLASAFPFASSATSVALRFWMLA